MLVIVDSIDRAAVYTDNVPHVAWDLMEVTDKPLTLILPVNRKSQACLPAYTTADRRAPKVFRPQNRRSRACASGAYSVYVRMAHERDRRFCG